MDGIPGGYAMAMWLGSGSYATFDANKGWCQNKTNQNGASAPPIEKGAGAEDAHKCI